MRSYEPESIEVVNIGVDESEIVVKEEASFGKTPSGAVALPKVKYCGIKPRLCDRVPFIEPEIVAIS